MPKPTADLNILENSIAPLLAEMGLELYTIDWLSQRRERVLRIVVKKPGPVIPGQGVTIDELVSANREISALLDLNDTLPENFRLDVESPGIERPLTRRPHFRDALGERVHIVLSFPVQGHIALDGKLSDVNESQCQVTADDGNTHRLPFSAIKSARTAFAWPSRPAKKQKKRSDAALETSATPPSNRSKNQP